MSTTFKPLYASAASVTITLASLATSSTRTAGRQSDEISNTSNLYADLLVSGHIKAGTSPTAGKQIDVWVVAKDMQGTPAYPDTITGAGDADKTWTSENVRNAGAKLLKTILVDSTTDRIYYFSNESVAALFGGVLPEKVVVFVAHDTAVNLNSSGSAINVQGANFQGV